VQHLLVHVDGGAITPSVGRTRLQHHHLFGVLGHRRRHEAEERAVEPQQELARVAISRTGRRERRRNWRSFVGPEWDYRDLGTGEGGWRIVGVNAQLFDSGFADEVEQLAWLEEVFASAAGRNLALFLHKPLFYVASDEPALGLSCLFPAGRAKLLALCRSHGVQLIGSGHLHVYRAFAEDGMQMVWAPATAFINSKEKPLPPVEGLQRRAGYIRYRLYGESATHEFIEPDLFLSLDVRNWSRATGSTVFLPPKPLAHAEILS
jgi:hypothetical protein